MAKKDFQKTPALNFITQEEKGKQKVKETIKEATEETSNMVYQKPGETEGEGTVKVMVTHGETEKRCGTVTVTKVTEETERPRKKKGHRTAYIEGKAVQIETKSKRVQILTTPSLHKKLKKQAKAEGLSVNELINKALTEYIDG